MYQKTRKAHAVSPEEARDFLRETFASHAVREMDDRLACELAAACAEVLSRSEGAVLQFAPRTQT